MNARATETIRKIDAALDDLAFKISSLKRGEHGKIKMKADVISRQQIRLDYCLSHLTIANDEIDGVITAIVSKQ